MFTKKVKILLGLILLVAALLRLYALSSVPPSPSLDEVSIGYNAFSILKTGKDEYGRQLPMLLRAYDDWRPALYVYTVVPSVAIFGLNAFAVRLPSVVFSIFMVYATYFIAVGLMQRFSTKENQSKAKHVGLLSALFLAISPWSIYLSRLGHEATMSLAFFVFGLAFFVWRKRYTLSLLCFTISFMSYQTEKIFVPVMMLGLVIFFWKDIRLNIRNFFLTSIFCLIILIPFFIETFSPNGLIRFSATNIFSANTDYFDKEVKELAKAVAESDFFGIVLHNRRVAALRLVGSSYISHFDPLWLFTNPNSAMHKVPNVGLFYLIDAYFLIVGLVVVFTKRFNKKFGFFLLYWILTAPLASAFTTQTPHAMRAYVLLPVAQIIIAIGVYWVYQRLLRGTMRNLFIFAYTCILFYSIVLMSYNYLVIFPKTQSQSFQYALHKAISYVITNKDKYKKIVFANNANLLQSYMFFLFQSKYDPKKYLENGGTKSGGFAQWHVIDKYEFRPINWNSDSTSSATLFVGNPGDFPSPAKVFSYLDGTAGIIVSGTDSN